ncbi:NDMA-dependent alcohol dehydrogenase [Amycolatopsis acidicola]|uniref:NDMA-dependent alcohol dehydrogenase n=1 Tax=Amycolatopsis acidicola TaxID=2596893 RepID=A0A5N0UPW1_9PSEU|nr:NDMA-dependent alcohol dehydrogenase [Amycolatopsis acidicola]KAA9151855.1 NDMA-dependent alcohol dehydrogenase [Amycolatopsis acidicola]
MRTKGALLYGPGQDWRVEEIEIDDPVAGEVQVELAASGLCHSDEHLVTGDNVAPNWPILGGHEGAGVVTKVGPGVTRVKEGDHVVLSLPGCGACEPCRRGHQNVCDESWRLVSGEPIANDVMRVRTGDGKPVAQFCLEGTFAPYATVSQFSVVPVDPAMPLHLAALIGCGVTAGWGAAMRVAEVKPGDVVVVAGLGGLGTAALLSALACGASAVFVIDPLPGKRKSAIELGATDAFESFEDATGPLREFTRGAMAHSVILTPGRMEGAYIEPAMTLVRKLGVLAVIGMGSFEEDDTKLNLAMLTAFNKTIRGGQLGGGSPQEDVRMLVRTYLAGRLPLEKMVTSTYRLEEINQGYQDMRDGVNLRGLIRFDERDR